MVQRPAATVGRSVAGTPFKFVPLAHTSSPSVTRQAQRRQLVRNLVEHLALGVERLIHLAQ